MNFLVARGWSLRKLTSTSCSESVRRGAYTAPELSEYVSKSVLDYTCNVLLNKLKPTLLIQYFFWF